MHTTRIAGNELCAWLVVYGLLKQLCTCVRRRTEPKREGCSQQRSGPTIPPIFASAGQSPPVFAPNKHTIKLRATLQPRADGKASIAATQCCTAALETDIVTPRQQTFSAARAGWETRQKRSLLERKSRSHRCNLPTLETRLRGTETVFHTITNVIWVRSKRNTQKTLTCSCSTRHAHRHPHRHLRVLDPRRRPPSLHHRHHRTCSCSTRRGRRHHLRSSWLLSQP